MTTSPTKANTAPTIEGLLRGMSHDGLLIDVPAAEQFQAGLDETVACLQSIVDSLAGRPINVLDTGDVERLLGEVRRPVSAGRTSPPHPVEASLARLGDSLRLRHSLTSLLASVDRTTGRVHPVFAPQGTSSGRIVCRAPALQALPRLLRRFVIAGHDHWFVEADLAHFELRVIADLSGDANLTAVFHEAGRDPHRETAVRLLGIDSGNVTDAQRLLGKQVNFAILFGMTPRGLAHRINRSIEEARCMIGRFLSGYPGVGRWIESIRAKVSDTGQIATRGGRVRSLPDVSSQHPAVRERALRQAVNHVVQGTAAEIFEDRLLQIAGRLPRGSRIALPIHDAVLVEAARKRRDSARAILVQVLEQPLPGGVPMQIHLAGGANWADCRAPP